MPDLRRPQCGAHGGDHDLGEEARLAIAVQSTCVEPTRHRALANGGTMAAMAVDLAIDRERLVALCRRYHVARLELFGSRAKGTARPDSDVDLLVTFLPGETPGLEFFGLANELEDLFGLPVDLLTRPRVERDDNPIFRDNVLSAASTLYAA